MTTELINDVTSVDSKMKLKSVCRHVLVLMLTQLLSYSHTQQALHKVCLSDR